MATPCGDSLEDGHSQSQDSDSQLESYDSADESVSVPASKRKSLLAQLCTCRIKFKSAWTKEFNWITCVPRDPYK